MPTSPRAVMRIIEGITAMCLGSAEKLIWIDETDAAAFSDGEHLYLPRPLGFHEEEYELLLALALREVARIWHSIAERFNDLEPEVLTYCVLVEEVRLKMYLARTFRGAPAIFGSAAAIVCAQGLASLADDGSEDERAKTLLVWAAAHAAALEVPVLTDGLEGFSEIVLRQVVPALVEEATQLAQGAGAVKSTDAAIALGNRIWALLHPHRPPQESPTASPSDTRSDNGSDRSPAANASTVVGTSSEDAVPGVQHSEEGQQAAGTPSDAAEAGEAGGTDEPSAGPAEIPERKPALHGPIDPLSDSLARLKGHPHAVSYRAQSVALREQGNWERSDAMTVSEAGLAMLAALLDEPDADRGLLATTAGFDMQDGQAQESLTSHLGAGGGSPSQPDQAGRLLLDAIPARLVTVLLRELQDVRRRPFQHSITGPRLAAAKLWRLSRLGDTRLFKKKRQATGIDAAVSLLLDRSASMKRNGFEQAVAVTQAFMLALQRIDGVKTSLDVFPGTDAVIEQVLAFGQNQNKARQRLRELEPQGSTPTGSAMARRLRQLLDVMTEAKLLVVITDGQPDEEEVALLAAVLDQAAMFRVQVIGVGININLQRRFPVSVSVRSASELPDALAVLFKERLLRP